MLHRIIEWWFETAEIDQSVWDACLLHTFGGKSDDKNGKSTALRVEANDLGFEPGTPDWYASAGFRGWLDSLNPNTLDY
jgi:hypothetical protein